MDKIVRQSLRSSKMFNDTVLEPVHSVGDRAKPQFSFGAFADGQHAIARKSLFPPIAPKYNRLDANQTIPFQPHPDVALSILAKRADKSTRQVFLDREAPGHAVGVVAINSTAIGADPHLAAVVLQNAHHASFGPGKASVIRDTTALLELAQPPVRRNPATAFPTAGKNRRREFRRGSPFNDPGVTRIPPYAHFAVGRGPHPALRISCEKIY